MRAYLSGVGTALSQLLHALAGGDPKMTTSARLGKQVLRGDRWAIWVCLALSFVLRDGRHCVKAFMADRDRTTRSDHE